ncbi:hypothetical protein [Flagellimonas sediminis]|uniref:Tetratricopeptide repeat protein n=1 Tax=Flagellimonas sediminis TaxID=2696468 RepID=A0A6I5KYA7_9FLAO|nr:hypothetical protein [Allomuricauda sediminis]NDV43342.1 hypothetical protein [Allomuricauda sediminis]|tara:strand:- start:224 stop:1705 length:1482 start_codon:yes stop_codon:yes gene_type:complete
MLTILTTTSTGQQVEEAIASIDRLGELVTIVEGAEAVEDLKSMVVETDTIKIPFDWYDVEPPYVFPELPFTRNNVLALVFYKIGNHQKAFEFVNEDGPLYHHLLIATHMQFGYDISEDMLGFAHKHSLHNLAILHHYGVLRQKAAFLEIKARYTEALDRAENDEIKVFTAKHYLNLLLDAGLLLDAVEVAKNHRAIAISDEAVHAMEVHLAAIRMARLSLPHDHALLGSLLELQMRNIAFYETKGLPIQAGLLLIDAAEVANFKEDFITSKDLINKAIQYFKQEDVPEFLGEAGFKKAVLLYTWSKNGSPQYYKAAINAFQDVLKVFKRDTHPQKFADVHHNLALIYSEIPVRPEEKPMWTAFCASSFKEVLAFYTKEEYPYEYAMANHNYATALMYFPPAKLHDNLEKASGLFAEALEIRTAQAYPLERALTLINQLELYWLTHNKDSSEELRKYEEMKSKAEEIRGLVNDPDLIAQADDHLKELEKVKSLI